jgi:hypothetical protein
MPNAFYFIRLIHGATRKPCPGERLWDAGQLVRGSVVRFLRARNQQGYDIYLLPYAEQYNAGYILIDLDQATPHILRLMRANGHEPCVVLQSSPGHLQAWIRVSTTPLQPEIATAIAKQLARTYGGDLGLVAELSYRGSDRTPGARWACDRAPTRCTLPTRLLCARHRRRYGSVY